MAENVTPVVLKVKDFAPREEQLVKHKYNQDADKKDKEAAMASAYAVTIKK